jgi:hypothetical protein
VLRTLRPVGGGLAAASLATIGAYFVAAVTSSHSQPWWPYVLLLGLMILGCLLYVVGQPGTRAPATGSAPSDAAATRGDTSAETVKRPNRPVRPAAGAGASSSPAADLRDLTEVPSLPEGREPARRAQHSWCIKCGFPFTRPQGKATCDVDRPGENWCKKRAATPIATRLERMAQKANTTYRVHPEWAAQQEVTSNGSTDRRQTNTSEEWWTE